MGNQDNSVDEETLNNATLNGGNSQVDLSTTINADDDAKLVRYKQQLQGSAKAATEANERAKNLEAKLAQEKQKLVKKEYNRIYRNDSLDIEALQALNSEDPELAQDLAKQFQIGGKQVEKIEELFEAFGVGKSKTSWTLDKDSLKEELKREIFEEIRQNSVIKNVTSLFSGLPEDKKEAAQSYFNKITNGRTLSSSDAEEFADMASMYVMKDNSNLKDKRIASMGSINLGNNTGMSPNYGGWGDDLLDDAEIAEYISTYAQNPRDKAMFNSIFNQK